MRNNTDDGLIVNVPLLAALYVYKLFCAFLFQSPECGHREELELKLMWSQRTCGNMASEMGWQNHRMLLTNQQEHKPKILPSSKRSLSSFSLHMYMPSITYSVIP